MLGFLLGREPALIGGAVTALLTVAVAFGADLTGEQVGALSAAVIAVLAVVVRRAVVPTATVKQKAEEVGPAGVVTELLDKLL